MNELPLPISLPPLAPRDSRSVKPIGGSFSITAAIARLDDIFDWQEGRCHFDYGYYRFIDHPTLRQLQEGLQQHYQVRQVLAYTSFKTAVMALLDYLLRPKASMTLKVVTDLPLGSDFSLENSLPACQTTTRIVKPEALSDLGAFSTAKDEILLLAPQKPEAFLLAHTEWVAQAKSQKIPVVMASPHWPDSPELITRVNYWVLPLNLRQHDIRGGAILSNADRQMAELFEARKQQGPLLASRNAAAFLGAPTSAPANPCPSIIRQFCQWEEARYGFLFPSGMNAIATLFHLVRTPERAQILVIGHPYTDTYSLLAYGKQRGGRSPENRFLHVDQLTELEALIGPQTAAILTETITNPLNDVPDLPRIAEIAHRHGVPVIVDNTFATPFNCQPLKHGADYVVHSTTKYFSGFNDHGGGALLCNDPLFAEKLSLFQERWDNRLSPLEAQVLWAHLQDFEDRMARFNQNAITLAHYLQGHPAVAQVYFAGLPSHPSAEVARRLLKGYGGVVSFRLQQDTREGLQRFYDSSLLGIHKAPSLGANQTMLCPYTLLAHYHESDETLAELGLSRYLVRVSVGCEQDFQPVLASLEMALQASLALPAT